MRVTIEPTALRGTVEILPSKSHLHRLLICAALAEGESFLRCASSDAEDVMATIACLSALGAKITRENDGLRVVPLRRDALPKHATLPCGESGSTLRFLLPVVAALGRPADFQLSGRLPERPMAPLDAELLRHGCRLWREGGKLLCCEGQLTAGEYSLPGNVSSQYISGLLFALPLLEGDSQLTVEGALESGNYVDMTLAAQKSFGLAIPQKGQHFEIQGGASLRASGDLTVEGDWSNAAFWLCAGAMPGGAMRCLGLNEESLQGDRAITAILSQMGAQLTTSGETLTVSEGARRAVEIDAGPIPDLIPALACVAAVSEGETRIKNAARLRLKESDRLTAVTKTLNALGARVTELDDGLLIEGVRQLRGGEVDACGDHRIAMMAAIAASAAQSSVCIHGAEAVRKSYPGFWQELKTLGAALKEEEV